MGIGVGTFEPAEVEPEKRKRRSRSSLTGGNSPGGSNGGRRGGGGGGGDSSGSDKMYNDADPVNLSRILTGFLLLVVLMTFCGLIASYVYVASNNAIEWHPFDLPFQIWISTVIIAASSVTYEFGKRSIVMNDIPGTRRWMVATTALGGIFIASQLVVWLILVNRGYYMRGNPYAGFFYILTAAHAVHVIGGIIALGATLLRSWTPALSDMEFRYRTNLARAVGWYWHFMGALWIVLFLLFGIWK